MDARDLCTPAVQDVEGIGQCLIQDILCQYLCEETEKNDEKPQ